MSSKNLIFLNMFLHEIINPINLLKTLILQSRIFLIRLTEIMAFILIGKFQINSFGRLDL